MPQDDDTTSRALAEQSAFKSMRRETVHWKNSHEMNKALHRLPKPIRAILLELHQGPMTRHEIRDALERLAVIGHGGRRMKKAQLGLEEDLSQALELNILEETDGRYTLTPAGEEMAGRMEEAIPLFMDWALSAETASLFSIVIHAVLSVLKLTFGFLFHSAGLIADGIDNTLDTLSAFLVWLGIRHAQERLASLFILVTMFVSLGGIAWATFGKVINPEPVIGGLTAMVVSIICGLVMLGLSAYQYLVGRRRSNLAVLCQAVDSRNHFWTSLMVAAAIFLSYLGEVRQIPWLYYADALASAGIGLLILRGVVDLIGEFIKAGDEPIDVAHFMKRALERQKERIVFNWVRSQLQQSPLTRQELERRFASEFLESTPRIAALTDMGFRPVEQADLSRFLDRFVERKTLVVDESKYWFVSRAHRGRR